MGVPLTSDHIQIKIEDVSLSQEPPLSSKAPDQDLKDIDVLCTFKIKIESPNLDHGCVKDQWSYANQDQDAQLQLEPPASSKVPNKDLKDMDVLCTIKIKIESNNSDNGYIKDQWQYSNQNQDVKSQSGGCSILKIFKSGLKGFQNQYEELNVISGL